MSAFALLQPKLQEPGSECRPVFVLQLLQAVIPDRQKGLLPLLSVLLSSYLLPRFLEFQRFAFFFYFSNNKIWVKLLHADVDSKRANLVPEPISMQVIDYKANSFNVPLF
jgi:hypothetical protein